MIGTLGQFVREIRDLLTGSGDPIPVDIGTSIDVSIDNTSIEVSNDVGNPIPVSDGGGSLTVDATSLPLPSGASTSALQTTGNTSLGNIDTKTPALQSGAVPIGDNSSSLTVDSKAYRSTVTITRPANTTTYTIGDVIGDTGGSAIHTLAGIGPSGGYVLIQSVSLVFSDAAVISGMAAFRLHFYQTSPTAIADNAAFSLESGERAAYMGYVDLPTPLDLGASLYTQADYPGRLIKLANASTSLFCELETRGAYQPASASTIELRVAAVEAGL